MVDFLILERIFYAVGSLVALLLGIVQLKRYWELPNIKLRSEFFFSNKKKNEYSQDVIPLKYECDLLNTGRDLVGEVVLTTESLGTYTLSGINNLKKNTPFKLSGIIEIIPAGINIKKIETPIKVKVFFKDLKGKKHAIHEFTLQEGISYGQITKNSL